ncbi:nucleotidyl transferase AbiEii/AbiGii toxin family protein [Stappia sp. P2PMeth1]|uniref:nucleotidyl transferase AbiEii/AbiGii toxin family protein n=1 Tax=Stappia sp. P2PMeth1 TaxID=2003586 RepID=UPI00164757B1|nr:nucleotidyl transferase AbiEii/AbiGii toxin family protein [Stappia sp. P2PMeth1]
MIPKMHITAWAKHAPWTEQRQVEQDLIISRAIIDLFSHPFPANELRFRGGTALNKLQFSQPLRCSEDIDLVLTSEGPIKPALDTVREVLEPWFGKPTFRQSPVAPKLNFSIAAPSVAA